MWTSTLPSKEQARREHAVWWSRGTAWPEGVSCLGMACGTLWGGGLPVVLGLSRSFQATQGATAAGTLVSGVRMRPGFCPGPDSRVGQPLRPSPTVTWEPPKPGSARHRREPACGVGLLTLSAVLRVSGSVPQPRGSGQLAVDPGRVWKGVRACGFKR